MGHVREILLATRLSRRRASKLGAPRSADMLLYSWLVVVIFLRFWQNCSVAVRELGRGPQGVGLAITEFCVVHFLLIAFLLPFLASVLSLGRARLDRRRLAFSPPPLTAVTGAELLTLVTSPLNALLLLLVIPAAIPLAFLPHAVARVAALFLGFVAAVVLGGAAGQALTIKARGMASFVRFAAVGILIGLVLANFDFQWPGGSIYVSAFQKQMLLRDQTGDGLLSRLGSWSPSAWIFQGWVLRSLGLVAASLAVFAGMVGASYHVRQEATARPRRRLWPKVWPKVWPDSGAARGTTPALLFRHELEHLVTAPSTLACLGISVAFSIWMLITPNPVTGITIAGCFLAILAGFSFPTNLFGADGSALRRYSLLCVDWKEVFAAKNAAWLSITGTALLPMAVTALRVSPSASLSSALTGALLLGLCILWGNVSSILLPSATTRNAAFANQVAPFLLWGVPLAFHRITAGFGSVSYDLAVLGSIAVCAVLYRTFLKRAARVFDGELQTLLVRLR